MPVFPRRRAYRALALIFVGGLSACATNPVTGKKQVALMSEAQEIQLGREADQQVRQEMGVYDDGALQRYVENIGLELASKSHRPNLPWTFTIVDSPAVNAFALPGGYVYVTRGILAYLNNEAELAGVLGHEIGHVTARHAVEQYTRSAGASIGLTIASIFFPGARPYGDLASTGLGVFFLKYSREDEVQSDRLGAEYAARGGWDPAGVAGMLTTLSRLDQTVGSDRHGTPNWLATHPQPDMRVERVQEVISKSRALLGDDPGIVGRNEYLQAVKGTTFGDDPREGVVRGNLFLHQDMRFSIEFPDGWDITNGEQQVIANEPGTKHFMVLDLVPDAQGRSLGDVAQRGMRSAGLKPIASGSSQQINGLDAWVEGFEGSVSGLGEIKGVLALIAHERNVLRVAGFGPRASFDQVAADVAASQRSFRGLSRDEARDIRPNRLDLYVVRDGDTWQSIAQHAGGGIVRASTLAIMNGFPPAEQPRVGDQIKIVTAG